MIALTRRYAFPAAHVLRSRELAVSSSNHCYLLLFFLPKLLTPRNPIQLAF